MLSSKYQEVYAGLRPVEEAATEMFIGSLKCMPVTPAIARQAGLLRRDWRAKGQSARVRGAIELLDFQVLTSAGIGRLPLVQPPCAGSGCEPACRLGA